MTITRKAEYASLKNLSLSGRVLDLGGYKGSEYHQLFKGDFTIMNANLSTGSDIVCDFEQPLPVESASYDAVLLINVLEHIFEYRQLIDEISRVLKPAGTAIIVVPFFIPYHASPEDYHRYTAPALRKALTASGFSNIDITTLGSGVWAARWGLVERLLPRPLQFLSNIAQPLCDVGDRLFVALAKVMGKKYLPSDYPLGYSVIARK